MTKLIAGLVFAVALIGCRSVPFEVRKAHDDAAIAQKTATESISTMLEKGVNNTQSEVDILLTEYEKAMAKSLELRKEVQQWLTESDLGDANEGHKTLVKTLQTIDDNHAVLFTNWTKLNTPDADFFVSEMHRHLGASNALLRRFDDWIRQFKISGGQ